VLLLFSIASWTIIVVKLIQISRVKKVTKAFVDYFWETKEFETINQNLNRFPHCPLANLFAEGYAETRHFLEMANQAASQKRLSTDLGAIENIARSLRKISSRQIDGLEKDVSFLATTASSTPFIGLFGTVWGIMNAFRDIGQAGSTSLAIVAPGISEALVTTAGGLLVAIPAVAAFNHFNQRITRFQEDLGWIVEEILEGLSERALR
jgi:biopolymer transport protein TolQ